MYSVLLTEYSNRGKNEAASGSENDRKLNSVVREEHKVQQGNLTAREQV